MIQSKHVRQIFTDYFINLQRCKHAPVLPIQHFRNPKTSVYESTLPQIIDTSNGPNRSIKTAGYIKSVVDSQFKEYLNVVGTNEYNHTFQEVYANCSFENDCKKSACEEALQLLTKEYRLNKQNLKVSYYGGDPMLHINPEECKEIWKHLGLSDDALIRGNIKSNFSQFKTGHCGAASGIYYINPKGTAHELLSIIFVTHERDPNGNIKKLHTPYTVSGMLLESLTTILQGKYSNYDSDLFQPIISAIQQHSHSGIPNYQGKFGPEAYTDVAYRKLADHIRAISICLADGLVPSKSLPLQILVHEAFSISEKVFMHSPGYLQVLFKCVSDILGESYPDLKLKECNIKELLLNEENIYKRKEVANKKCREYFTPSWFDDEEVFNKRIGELFNSHQSLDETMNINEDELDKASKINDQKADLLENMDKELRRNNTKSITDLITQEMLAGIEESRLSNHSFMVHFLACSYLMEFVNLSEDVLEISDIPVMLFACCNGVLKVACRVPKQWLTSNFNATNWLSQVITEFNSDMDSNEVEDSRVFASMKGKKVSLINCESLVQDSMKKAIAYIKTNLPEMPDKKQASLPRPKLSKRS